MSGYTPGPWAYQEKSDAYTHIVRAGEPAEKFICQLSQDQFGEANARLIAAAPDMLAALKAQHNAIDILMARLIGLDKNFMPTKSPIWPAVLQGNAAITKAEGRS